MNLSKWFFANWYDVLNSIVEPYVIPYRNQTTSKCEGHVVEIGGGTGANLLFFDKAEKIKECLRLGTSGGHQSAGARNTVAVC